jgi:hypothetical protein
MLSLKLFMCNTLDYKLGMQNEKFDTIDQHMNATYQHVVIRIKKKP